MRNGIPRHPVSLAVFLGNLIAGAEKHQQDKPLPKDVLAEIVAAKSKLDLLNTTVQTSKGQARSSTQTRKTWMETGLIDAERFRAAVVSVYGPKDAALVDYALATRRKAHKAANGENGTVNEAQVTAKRLSHAQARVNRNEVKLAQILASLDKSKALLVKREAEAARVQPVTLPEPSPARYGGHPVDPGPTHVPTSSSGTK